VDRTERFVLLATEAVCIGEPEVSASYLNQSKIISVAKATGADAIHPGYGFLAENAIFARAVNEAGLRFIGPAPDCIEAMGDKVNARAAMIEAGVPVIPGVERDNFDEASLREAAASIGFPVMLKASAGGGGKGIRIVEDANDLWRSYERVVSESEKSFGDGRVFLERALIAPHHVEVQILGDHHGNVVHLLERECSIQRRHQKVVEETPSPFLTPKLRAEMTESAVVAARALGYTNAGTVEFLVDAEKNFYFLEVNTRLQVEHPVTEEILGIDIVELQLRVAAGEPLPFTQGDLVPRGHSIEVRICAEDADNGFMPAVGRIVALTLPSGPGVRIDSGLYRGQEITLHYDPMLGKLIVWGENRDVAIGRLKQALAEFKIAGVKTNISLLGDIVRDQRFQDGVYDTSFLSSFAKPPLREDQLKAALIGAALAKHTGGSRGQRRDQDNAAQDPWKMSGRMRGVQRS
jgi:acetyl-CoA carboxylase biotin carboxylase subunit